MSTCHALPEAKLQLLDENACSVLYHYKAQKIIFHLLQAPGAAQVVFLCLWVKKQNKRSHTHTSYGL